MTVKEQVLNLLAQDKGSFVSGEQLAQQLQISRNAIWKAINGLRAEGYTITAVTNKGYQLTAAADILTAAAITEYLRGPACALRLEKRQQVASTNLAVRSRALEGEPEGLVLLAESQTAGRGRRSRSFYSPAQSGIYMSLLLRPACSLADSMLLTTAAAAAVALAIERVTGRAAQIKWVNDVWLEGRKVSGILTEAAVSMESGGLDYAIVGIGINVCESPEGFPEELSQVAAAIYRRGEEHRAVRSRLAAEVLNNFMAYYQNLAAKEFLAAYKQRSFVVGRQVFIEKSGQQRAALVLAVDDNFNLQVRYTDGSEELLGSGEISLRLA